MRYDNKEYSYFISFVKPFIVYYAPCIVDFFILLLLSFAGGRYRSQLCPISNNWKFHLCDLFATIQILLRG